MRPITHACALPSSLHRLVSAPFGGCVKLITTVLRGRAGPPFAIGEFSFCLCMLAACPSYSPSHACLQTYQRLPIMPALEQATHSV